MPNQVAVISPEGENGYLPEDKLQEAVGRGFKPATMVTSPEGDSGWMPRENVGRAIKERGFKVGQAPTSAEASPSRQLTDHTQATLEGAGNIATGAKDAVKGAYDMVKAPEEGTAEDTVGKIAGPGGLALYRMIRGTLEGAKGVSQVPGAVRDIAANPEGANYASKVVGETAGGVAVQAAAGKAGESAGTPAAETSLRTAGKLVKGISEDVPIVRKVMKVGKYAKEAQAETAARRGGTPSPEPSFPQYDKPAAQDVTKPTESGGSVAHPDAAQFEQTFGQPIDNYVDESGKFNTKDFLDEVVKPKTEPPNAVIAKTFGNDGVELVNKLNGKPLEKWESSAPDSEPKGGSARLRAKEILKGDRGEAGAPGTVSEYANRMATATKSGEVSARGFLKKVGADEGSVLNGAGRTPMEHADSVIYHREQIRAGKSTPVELHVDENGNTIGGDGRHRAMAAIQEHGPDAKIKIKVIQHSFQGVE